MYWKGAEFKSLNAERYLCLGCKKGAGKIETRELRSQAPSAHRIKKEVFSSHRDGKNWRQCNGKAV